MYVAGGATLSACSQGEDLHLMVLRIGRGEMPFEGYVPGLDISGLESVSQKLVMSLAFTSSFSSSGAVLSCGVCKGVKDPAL